MFKTRISIHDQFPPFNLSSNEGSWGWTDFYAPDSLVQFLDIWSQSTVLSESFMTISTRHDALHSGCLTVSSLSEILQRGYSSNTMSTLQYDKPYLHIIINKAHDCSDDYNGNILVRWTRLIHIYIYIWIMARIIKHLAEV